MLGKDGEDMSWEADAVAAPALLIGGTRLLRALHDLVPAQITSAFGIRWIVDPTSSPRATIGRSCRSNSGLYAIRHKLLGFSKMTFDRFREKRSREE